MKSAEGMLTNEITDTLEAYENEAYIIQEKKHKAQLLPLFDSERNIWLDPICDENNNPHYFIISRLLSKVFEQYDFDLLFGK